MNKLGILISLHRSCYATKRALLECICGCDVILSKLLAPSFRDLHLSRRHSKLFLSESIFLGGLEGYVLFGFVRESFQTQRVSNLKCPNLYKAAPHPRSSSRLDKQGFLIFLSIKCVPCTLKLNTPTRPVCSTDINYRMPHAERFY